MKNFIKKWQEDKKFRAKIKLLLYFILLIFAVILARGVETDHSIDLDKDETPENKSENQSKNIIDIKEEYQYEINVTINDKIYKYSGIKNTNQTTITKEVEEVISNYLFKENNYYKQVDKNYILTTKDEIYDEVNYSYLDLANINLYLDKATHDNHQYLVYLKDIILGDTSEEYFTIILNNNKIDIDYTPLVKKFNNNIYKYNVIIILEEIE